MAVLIEMKKEYYFWKEFVCPVNEDFRRTYHLKGILEDTDEKVFTNIISLADFSKKVFDRYKDTKEFKYDSLVFYHSLDNNVNDKPSIEVKRTGTLVKGSLDLLRRLNEEILTILGSNQES